MTRKTTVIHFPITIRLVDDDCTFAQQQVRGESRRDSARRVEQFARIERERFEARAQTLTSDLGERTVSMGWLQLASLTLNSFAA